MRTRLTPAVLAVLALAAAGCSSDGSGDGKPDRPAATRTVTAKPTVDRAAAREQCVDAWAELFEGPGDPDVDDEPAICKKVPGERTDMYMEGLQKRNKANQDSLDECLDDSSCTAWPVEP